MKLFLILILSFAASAFDHSHKIFNDVLSKRVQFKGHQSLVDYKGLKSKPKALNEYLKSLSSVSKSEYNQFSSKQKLSFLINAYNAFTLKLIIDHYPVKSIKDIGSIFSSPWKKEFFKLFGKEMNLDTIEHGMIRKDFKEPRIHFAVNCASIGCPSLAKSAFVAENLNSQLEAAAMNFLKNKDKNYALKNTLKLSKIFDWYGGDFENLGGVEVYIKSKLGLKGKYKIDYLDYDWNLNEQ